jgi:phage terminase large subunit-like protein
VIENGFVHIPETAPWLGEYLHELSVFPNGSASVVSRAASCTELYRSCGTECPNPLWTSS